MTHKWCVENNLVVMINYRDITHNNICLEVSQGQWKITELLNLFQLCGTFPRWECALYGEAWRGKHALVKLPFAGPCHLKWYGYLKKNQQLHGNWHLQIKHCHSKRQCNEIFDLYFFHESNPTGTLINLLKWFCWKIHFREDIRIQSSKNSTPRSAILRGAEIFDKLAL